MLATTPGLLPLWAISIVARLPNAALSLVLLLRTEELSGSYAAGGAVAAASGLASGVGQPMLGRLIDRRGQRRVLLIASVVSTAAIAAFALLPDGAPVLAAVLIAAIAGGTQPPISSCLRALLTDAVAPEHRHKAFAVDSTLFELVYILGPAVIIGLVGTWSLQAAVAACALLTVSGTGAFAATRLSRGTSGALDAATELAGPLRDPGVRVLLVAVFLFGLSVAGLELGLAAFAAAEGARNAVGWLLALSGVGSMIGGLAAARTPPPPDPARRLLVLLVVLAVLEVPLALAGTLAAMGVAVAVASLAIAPSLALTFQLASETAPAGTVTEALTWLSSAIAAGVAVGSALAGVLAEHASTTLVLATIAAYTALEAAWVAARVSVLRT